MAAAAFAAGSGSYLCQRKRGTEIIYMNPPHKNQEDHGALKKKRLHDFSYIVQSSWKHNPQQKS